MEKNHLNLSVSEKSFWNRKTLFPNWKHEKLYWKNEKLKKVQFQNKEFCKHELFFCVIEIDEPLPPTYHVSARYPLGQTAGQRSE